MILIHFGKFACGCADRERRVGSSEIDTEFGIGRGVSGESLSKVPLHRESNLIK